MLDKEFFNKYNNIFRDNENYDLIFNYIKKGYNKNDDTFDSFFVRSNRLYYKDDDTNKKLEVVPKRNKKAYIKEIVDNLDNIGLGINKLYEVIKEFFIGITQKDLKEYLRGDAKYQLVQPLNPVGRNNATIMNKPRQLFQADHLHLDPDKKYKYVLCCIDHFSKMAFAEPQTNLTSKATIDAFIKILNKSGNPRLLQVDNAIYNDKKIQEFMEEKGIKLRASRPSTPTDNGLVENFNKQLRTKIYAGYVKFDKKEWVKYLDDYVKSWNNTKHGTTKYKPIDIYYNDDDKELRKEVRQNTKDASKVRKNIKLNIDDWVRVALPAYYNYIKAIEKSKLEKKKLVVNWTPQKFKIIKILKSNKGDYKNWRYLLEDENGKVLQKKGENVYFFGTELKLTEPYDYKDAEKGIFSYSGVKNYAVRFNPKKEKAPKERITNQADINIPASPAINEIVAEPKEKRPRRKTAEKVVYEKGDKISYIWKDKKRYEGIVEKVEKNKLITKTIGINEIAEIPLSTASLKLVEKKRKLRNRN